MEKTRSTFTIGECRQAFLEELEGELSKEVDPTGEVTDSFEFRETLPPNLFDDQLQMPERYRSKLEAAAMDFWASVDAVPEGVGFEDIVVVGSAVSYSWSPFSDIDLHIKVDFSKIDENFELVKDYFMKAKAVWNEARDPVVAGFDVEVYVEDLSEENVSLAEYSVKSGGWEVSPEKTEEPRIDVNVVGSKALGLMRDIDEVIEAYESGNFESADTKDERFKRKLKNLRQSGLEKAGVFSVENLAFKALRRNGMLEKLSTARKSAKDEHFSEE